LADRKRRKQGIKLDDIKRLLSPLLRDDWLWQSPWKHSEMMGSGYAQGVGFTESLSTPAPPQQETELQPEPEPSQPEPQFTEEDIQQLVDELEQIWLTDEDLRSAMTEAEWQELIEGVRQSPVE
jgi:hypothetical protein